MLTTSVVRPELTLTKQEAVNAVPAMGTLASTVMKLGMGAVRNEYKDKCVQLSLSKWMQY